MMQAALALWWVFPAAVAFATIAVGSGVSGALFFSPFFMLAVGLPPAQAVGAGLLTEVFGMGNGLRSYVRQRLVDYATARWLLLGAGIHALSAAPAWHVVVWSVPGVLVGSTLGSRVGRYLPASLMEKVLGGVFALVGGLVLVLELTT